MISNALKISSSDLPQRGYPPLAAFKMPAALRNSLQLAMFTGSGMVTDMGPASVECRTVGAPVATTRGFELSSSAYIEADISDSPSITMAILTRRLGPAAVGYCGNLDNVGVNAFGAGFVTNAAGTSVSFNAGRTGVTAAAGQIGVTSAPDSWALYLGRAAEVQPSTIINLTTGLSNSNATVQGVARATNSGQRIRVGSLIEHVYVERNEVALFLSWGRYLSDPDVALFSNWAKAYAATLGITA